MADDRAESVRALAGELAERDGDVAAQLVTVVELAAAIGGLRARAAGVRQRLAGLPAELEAAARSEDEARRAVTQARGELADAEARLQQVEERRRSSAEERARAHSEAKVARETLADAEHRLERSVAHRAQLGEERVALLAEADTLPAEARPLADALRTAPRMVDAAKGPPGSSLPELDEWAGRARAALFVARAGLESERERLVAEASTLASAITGEAIPGTSVALARRRIDEALS